jgi:hypothetical protein
MPNKKQSPVDAAVGARLRDLISTVGLDAAAAKVGLAPITVLRAAAGSGVFPATARVIASALAPSALP